MRFLWITLLFALPLHAEEAELCEQGKTFVYGCDPVEPLYQIRVDLSPAHGGVELGYSQTPLPPEMKPAAGESCTPKKRFETTLKSGTPTGTGVLAFAALGTEIRLTNLSPRAVKINLTGTPEEEPLPKGETRKFSLSTAQEERHESIHLPLWRISQKLEKKRGKVVCTIDSKKHRLKAQVLLLKVQAEETGLWEESTMPDPTPAPVPSAPPPIPTR